MNYFLGLMTIYMTYMLLAFLISNGKILSPSFIFSTSFTLMIVLAYIFKDRLGFEVNYLTFKIFATGGILFLISENIVKTFIHISKSKSYGNRKINIECENLYINKQIQHLLLVFMFLSLMLAVVVLFVNTSNGSFGSRMSQYKNALIYSANKVKFRTIVSLLYKINTGISYFCGYILIYNLSLNKIRLHDMKNYILIIITFGIFSTVSQGARQPLIEMVIFLPIVYASLHMHNRDKKKIYRLMRKVIPLLLLAVVLFYYTSTLVGRRQTKRGILEYLAVYICGGLYSFNLHANEPARNVYWGQASFADIYNLLIKMGFVPSEANMQYHTFDLYGNTVTMFGRWYEDFGQIGVYLMTILVAMFFSILFYTKIVPNANSYNENHIKRMIYCKFIISLVWAGYDDRIRALLSLQTVSFCIVIVFLWWFCIKQHYKFKIR